MGDVVNLNQFRKKKLRSAAAQRAQANRLRFGLCKDVLAKRRHDAEKAKNELDNKQLEDNRRD